MNNNMIKKSVAAAVMMVAAVNGYAQDLTGKVLNSENKPVSGVVITCPGCPSVRSAADGSFSLSGVKNGSVINFWHDGFYTTTEYIRNAKNVKSALNIHMIETSKSRYNETSVTPFNKSEGAKVSVGADNVNRKDFGLGSLSVENAMKGEVAGLQVVNKSGMTGEGAYLQLRGIKSFTAENSPLIVINGVPYLPDMNESQIVNGYSRSVFQALNNQDIRNITVLKGADAALYGSMGSNGVIIIETDQATASDMNTRISFNAVTGLNFNKRRIPLMNSSQYKGYLSDMGLTYYDNMESFFKDFTFLSDPKANNANLYQYDTDWQNQILKASVTNDYLFRVEGGDAIAKYNISLGYQGDNGTLRNTNTDRYNAQINASVLVSKKFEILASINTAYLTGQYQEQGMQEETNPLLAAYRRSPLLSPYKSDMYGDLTISYNDYNFGAINNAAFRVSNPLAIVNTLTAKDRQYDLNSTVQLNYRPNQNLTVNGQVGLYYNYNQEETFIPGVTNMSIVPLFDRFGEANNTVRVGTNYTFNMYYGLTAAYKRNFTEKHKLNAVAGAKLLTASYEYDAAFGRNTNNDYYQTMGDVQSLGRYFAGYNNKWNWLDVFAHADYTYDNLLKVGVTASYDGASSIGEDATRMTLYPAVEGVLMAKELAFLKDVDFVNKLNLFANYSVTGNSRFSSKFGKYYYTSQPYQTIAGVVRANLPNTSIKAESTSTFNVGLETMFWNNRAMLNVGYFNSQSKDILVAGTKSSILGTSEYCSNDGQIKTSGVELSLAVTPVITSDFKWTIGGNISAVKNTVKSLGQSNDISYTLSDGATIISRVGENPYAFYGYEAKGVYATTAEADKANLKNRYGVAYQAGDVRFVDQNNDGVINEKDKVVLGSATPDFFGGFFTRFEYKNFALDMTFAYSVGNEAYNAVRRVTESGFDFSNQSTAVLRRWSMEGQVTDMPRSVYGDPMGNNDFSSRWIEDASYLKLRDVTLSYSWNKPILKFIQSGTIYVTGQNLFCLTDYLGLDPEFSYSNSPMMQGVDYAKMNAPRAIKLGVNLKF